MIDVSIIIPTFNRLWSLPRCVESCRGARCRTEIIVIDDGSTDGTWEWLSSQSDIVAILQENQGQCRAINNAFAKSRGRYVRFLDSDDYLVPGAIDRQFEAAIKSGAGVVYGRVDYINERTKLVEICPETPQWDDFMAVMLGEGYGSHFLGMQFAREFAEKAPWRPEFPVPSDRIFLLEIALQNPAVYATHGCVGYWVQHGTQMTAISGLKLTVHSFQKYTFYRKVLDELERRGELTPRRASATAAVLWPVIHALARTHLSEAYVLERWLTTKLCPGFRIPETRSLQILYKVLGFKTTQRLLRVRRWLVPTRFRTVPSA